MSTIEDILLFSVRDDNVKHYHIHHEIISCSEYQLQLFLDFQMAVALNLLCLTLQLSVRVPV